MTTFEQGWAARPFKEQFPHMRDDDAKQLDAINEAVTTLYMSGILTEGARDSIRRKRVPRAVAEALERARVQQKGEPT